MIGYIVIFAVGVAIGMAAMAVIASRYSEKDQ